MDEQQSGPAARSRRPSGRDAKIAARTARSHAFVPYITRNIPYYEVLTAGGLELLENNADTILEEIGIDFRDDRSEEHTSELQSRFDLVCRLLLEKKKGATQKMGAISLLIGTPGFILICWLSSKTSRQP